MMWPEKEEAEYRDWLNGGRERAAAKRIKNLRLEMILWVTSLSVFILAQVLHIIGEIVR